MKNSDRSLRVGQVFLETRFFEKTGFLEALEKMARGKKLIIGIK